MQEPIRLWARWRLLMVGLAVAAAGCGGKDLVPVTGTVKFPDGKPVPKDSYVEFKPIDAVKAEDLVICRGFTQEDGSYALTTYEPGDGAKPGKYQVLVAPPRFLGDPDEQEVPVIIDPKHEDYATSGLEFTVTDDPEKNHYDIVVQYPPGKRR